MACSLIRQLTALLSRSVVPMILLVPQLLSADDSVLTVFTGSLLQPSAASDQDDGEVIRRFETQLIDAERGTFFVVTDDSRHGCPWPDSFGRYSDATSSGLQPHLVYDYGGTEYIIALPPLTVSLPDQVAEGTEWEQSGWLFRAVGRRQVENTPAWVLEASERRGRRQSLTVDASTGTTLTAEADVFMGQGDQFKLTIARTSVQPLSTDTSRKLDELQSELEAIQTSLQRRPDSFQRNLSARQTSDVAARIETLQRLSADTPLQSFVRRVADDLTAQQKRLATAASHADRLLGTDLPEFVLTLAGGGSMTGDSLRDKTVVLHFWDYRDAPLSEPYGQTGYLEYLFNQNKARDVRVVGISTNPELQSADNRGRGLRSIRKLTEFMNLSYPIGYDDGSLLKALGDPRDARGQLPLWIVITPAGKITHYHAGFYEVDARQGLKELESALAETTAIKSP